MDRPYLGKVTFEFIQDSNTDGTTGIPETDGCEELIIEVMSAPENLMEGPGYLVLRTRTGWSINDASEIADLVDYVSSKFEAK